MPSFLKPIVFLHEARNELAKVPLYYISIGRNDLANRAEEEVRSMLSEIQKNPKLCRLVSPKKYPEIRVWWPGKTFEYRIGYREKPSEIQIIAIFHPKAQANPYYWIGRDNR